MRLLLSFLLISCFYIGHAQNVGINKANPTEALDVNGNVNVDGKIKLNGSAGQPGQTLMVQSDGTQQWVNSFGYKNLNIIPLGSDWTVPAGVREVMFEVVGGGGGGAKGGGGGGAGYVVARVKVAPGAVVSSAVNSTLVSGSPAGSEVASGFDGAQVVVTGNGFLVRSFGGNAATATTAGLGGFCDAFGDSVFYRKLMFGGSGSMMVETYSQRTSTEFITSRKQGDGGICLFNPLLFSKGGFFSFNTISLFNITLVPSNYFASCFGCGGAGGNSTDGAINSWGGYGGDARIHVWY